MVKVWGLNVSQAWLLILLALADCADDGGRSVRPSVAFLAWKVNLTERQVRRILADLRVRGVLVVVRPAGQHRPVEYRLRLDVLPAKPPFRSTDKMSGLDRRTGMTSDLSRGDIHNPRPDAGVSQSVSTESSQTEPISAPHGNGESPSSPELSQDDGGFREGLQSLADNPAVPLLIRERARQRIATLPVPAEVDHA